MTSKWLMWLYTVTIALSAFLLFQVQPLIARIILPWFGGSAGVWTTCLLFFQFVLLLGYGYAHLTTQRLAPRTQCGLHLILLCLSGALLHLLPDERWQLTGTVEPTLPILALLARTVGLPYLLLSASSPLLQAWFVRRYRDGQAPLFPYRLYALSNAGSLLALLSYPICFEPYFALRQQAGLWTAGYLLFALLCGALAWRSATVVPFHPIGSDTSDNSVPQAPPAPSSALPAYYRRALLWVALSCCSSTLLCAVTNHLSANIAAIPFLWVAPLSLYLITFIVSFSRRQWEWRQWFLPVPALAIAGMAYGISSKTQPIYSLIPLFLFGLTVCCLLCHGELARLKPAPRHLTGYYLFIALGGALGSLFVAGIAPRLFPDNLELPLAIAACGMVAMFALYWPSARRRNEIALGQPPHAFLFGIMLVLLWWMGLNVRDTLKRYRLTVRNFYGVLRVRDNGAPGAANATRALMYGSIRHGEQFLRPDKRRLPTTYYGPDSGIGLLFRALQPRGPLHVGVIGLGTGTMAAYGRPGDVFRFYEINPLVVKLAATEFTYLADTQATVQVAPGDARLTLEHEPPQGYDVLLVDAFSGDAVPVHLLTREAFALYFRHLKQNGVLVVNVTNRYLDLSPIVASVALALHHEARMVHNASDVANNIAASDWVLLTAQPQLFSSPALQGRTTAIPIRPGMRLWTDDYSSLYGIIKLGDPTRRSPKTVERTRKRNGDKQ